MEGAPDGLSHVLNVGVCAAMRSHVRRAALMGTLTHGCTRSAGEGAVICGTHTSTYKKKRELAGHPASAFPALLPPAAGPPTSEHGGHAGTQRA